jgi:hypothetical protein
MQFHLSRLNGPHGAAFRCMVSGRLFRTEREAQEWQADVIEHLAKAGLIGGPDDTGDLPALQLAWSRHFRPDNALG